MSQHQAHCYTKQWNKVNHKVPQADVCLGTVERVAKTFGSHSPFFLVPFVLKPCFYDFKQVLNTTLENWYNHDTLHFNELGVLLQQSVSHPIDSKESIACILTKKLIVQSYFYN